MTPTPNEHLEGLARDFYARFTKSHIPDRLRYWAWDHGLVSETTKARYENAVYDALTAMLLVDITDEEEA